MTQAFFIDQINRLKTRFGAKAFDVEMMKVVAREVSTLPEDFFRKTVDEWIGTRKTANPPLLVDFREARLHYEKQGFTKDVRKAANGWATGLKDVLRKHYNVDSLSEAFQMEQLKIRLGGADGKKGGAK